MKKISNNIEPFIGNEELKSLRNAIKKKEISTYGSITKKFEDKISNFTNYKYTISVNSGSSGLFLAFKSLNPNKDEIIITSTYTFVATINSIVASGCKPWIFDVDENNLCLNLDKLSKELNEKLIKKGKFYYHKIYKKKVIAICPVIFSGLEINLNKLKKIALKFNLKIISDSAGAFGLFKNQKNFSSYVDINVISFNGNKLLTTGGGGTISTNNYKVYKSIKSYSSNCTTKSKYIHHDNGFNMRMTNIHASIGIAQLGKKNKIFKLKRKICSVYLKGIKNNKIKTLCKIKDIPWVFPIITQNSFIKNKIKNYLKENNINLNEFWIPMHNQPFKEKMIFSNFNNIDKLKNRILILPSDINLKLSVVKKITDKLNKI